MRSGTEQHTMFVTYAILVILLLILWVLYMGLFSNSH